MPQLFFFFFNGFLHYSSPQCILSIQREWRSNYLVTYANLFKQHYLNPFLFALIWIIKALPQDISYFRRGMMMVMIMLMKPVMLGAGVVEGQGFPPTVHPSVSPNDQRYICTWMRYCLWTDWIVIVKQEGSLFSLRDQQCVLYSCASYY